MADSKFYDEFYDDRLIGYLAVPFADGKEVLASGYVGSMKWGERHPPPGRDKCHTARKNIPFHKDRTKAVKAMLEQRESETFTLLLEIRKEADDLTIWPYAFEKSAKTGTDNIKLGADQVLDPKFLKDGVVLQRQPKDHANAPCPFCDKDLATADKTWLHGLDMPDVRGKVGMAVYVGGAFMVVPCPELACIKAQKDRQDRLDQCPTLILYHACSRLTANLIKRCGGKFLRGQGGAAGGGIYFSQTVRETWWKAEDMTWLADDAKTGGGAPQKWLEARGTPGWEETGYVFFECEVKMGNVFHGTRWEKGLDFKKMIQHEHGPFDSCVLDRGQTGYPKGAVPKAPVIAPAIEKTASGHPQGTMLATRIEDVDAGKAQASHGGYEFIVYSWDQVRIIRELPFKDIDPPPPLRL